jgi:hypothetical protein
MVTITSLAWAAAYSSFFGCSAVMSRHAGFGTGFGTRRPAETRLTGVRQRELLGGRIGSVVDEAMA